MKNVDDLIENATDLADRGLSKGEIADELNVSRETAHWLVERGTPEGQSSEPEMIKSSNPSDIHVDWNVIGRDSTRVSYIGAAMADLLSKQGDEIDLTIGIEKAGTPLATIVARELDTDLSAYAPSNHQWDDGNSEGGGSFSRNFAKIRERNCYIVDDIITSGTTLRETIVAVRDEGGEPVAGVVVVDKQGLDRIGDVPIYSLVNVVPVSE